MKVTARSRLGSLSLAALLTALLAACSAGDTGTSPPVIHQHASTEAGIFANAYLVEGPEAVVAIDATLTVSEARALADRIETIGKPLAGVLVTHGHPDHYNGLAIITAGTDAPIYAVAGVDEVIRRDDADKEAQWSPVFGEEWPAERAFPTHRVVDGERVEIEGMGFVVHDVGPSESHHDTYWVLQGAEPAAFVGDLVFNGVHAYVSDGHTGTWLDQLGALERDLDHVETLYVGHGDPGPLALIDAQRAYLELFRETVRNLANGADTLSDEAKAELTQIMTDHLGSDKLEFLVGMGADAVAAELLRE